MMLRSCLVFALLATMVTAAGCASESTDASDEEVGTADLTSMKSPEALARWLGTNHAVAWLPQFRDTRAGGVLLSVDYNGSSPHYIQFGPPNTDQGAKMKEITEVGKKADAAGVAIAVGETQYDQTTGCYKPGVYATARDPQVYDLLKQMNEEATGWNRGAYNDGERAKLAAVNGEISVNVTIVAPGGGNVAALQFGVVKRSLNPAASSPENLFWTVLSAETYPSCGGGEGDGDGEGGD